MKRFLFALLVCVLAGGTAFGQSLRIYTEIAPPNQYLDASGQLTGYMVELVQELQKRVGNTDPIALVPWIRAYHELESEPNVVLFSMVRSAKRNPLFQWVGPTGESSFAFYVKAGSPHQVKSLEDAKTLELIGVYREDARDQYLTRLGFTNLDRSIDQEVMLKKLMDGRIAALASSPIGMEELAKSAGVRFEDLKETYTFLKVQIYIAFSRKTPGAVVKAWTTALNAMKRDRTFELLYRKYYPSGPLPGPELKPY
jgi:polar amino acid transport system substrate-binding protein